MHTSQFLYQTGTGLATKLQRMHPFGMRKAAETRFRKGPTQSGWRLYGNGQGIPNDFVEGIQVVVISE